MATSLRHIATEPANLSQRITSRSSTSEKALDELQARDRSPSRTSDSDLSIGTNSLSHNSSEPPPLIRAPLTLALSTSNGPTSIGVVTEEKVESKQPSPRANRRKNHRGSEWEILEGLRDGQRCEEKPAKKEGYLMKRRKWPLKGWHKRYFSLDKGILTYAKSTTEMARGKFHGSVDVGLSVISAKSMRRRIDIDADEHIYHLKAKNQVQFQEWVPMLRHHRLYRQHEIAFGSREAPKITTPVEDVPVGGYSITCTPNISGLLGKETPTSRQSTRHVRSPISQQSRVAAWILDSSAIDQGNKDVSSLQDKLYQLTNILQQLETASSMSSSSHLELPEIDQVATKKERRRFHLKKNKKSNKNNQQQQQCATCKSGLRNISQQSVEIVVSKEVPVSSSTENILEATENVAPFRNAQYNTSLAIQDMAHLSCSHPSLTTTDDILHPSTLPDSTSMLTCALVDSVTSSSQTSLHRCQEEFLCLAKEVHSGLRSMLHSLQTERERLKQVLEAEAVPSGSSSSLISSLRNSLNQSLQQNRDLRHKLHQIHTLADVSCVPPATAGTPAGDNGDEHTLIHQPLQPSLSHESSSVLSTSEYFDAAEILSNCTTSSEGSISEDGEYQSDMSDEGTEYTPIPSEIPPTPTCNTGRRSKLPAPKPDTGDFSLWNLLCKNIGKDLSKVCMPVTINEPLNVLQRLCEELEYSELLDKAAETTDRFERMVYVAAFAVSAYSASYYRAGHKPFNPLLGETYECIREDKGFRFISEQVSHHPPVSACYAESRNFIFSQDMRIKTKFWGKSMEILPVGTVNIILPKTNDHYRWNKVTTCVHNIFSGQRWADQYGEMIISESTGEVTCKLTFVRASYWSSKRHEVFGSVMTRQGEVVHNLFGKWTEAFYCGMAPSVKCIWRPGAMPEDYEVYYGFTRFAIELNETDQEMTKWLPPTDTRFRPDQRLLEEGNVSTAETTKIQIEQAQRERRKKREELEIEYKPMWFKKEILEDGREEWVYNQKYWDVRANPGFINVTFPEKLW